MSHLFLFLLLILLALPLVTSILHYDCRIDLEHRRANAALCGDFSNWVFIGRCSNCIHATGHSRPKFTLTGLGFYCGLPPCEGHNCRQCTINMRGETGWMIDCLRAVKRAANPEQARAQCNARAVQVRREMDFHPLNPILLG